MKRKNNAIENRGVLRLLTHCEGLAGDKKFPSLKDVQPAEIADIWPYCFVLDVTTPSDVPTFHYIGKSLEGNRQIDLVILSSNELESQPLIGSTPTRLGQAAKLYHRVLSSKSPVATSGTFEHPNGNSVLYRSILMPLSVDQENLDYLLGAVTSREVTNEGLRSYQVQHMNGNGSWEVNFVSDEKEVALSIAHKHINGIPGNVRVVEEIHDQAAHCYRSNVVFEKSTEDVAQSQQ